MMLMPCWPSAGPTGGAGVALPALHCSFTMAWMGFAISSLLVSDVDRGRSDGLHLQEVWPDRWRAAEDADHHLDLASLVVHFVHDPGESTERSIHDPNVIRDAER